MLENKSLFYRTLWVREKGGTFPVNRRKNWVAAVLVLPRRAVCCVFFMLSFRCFRCASTSFFPDESFSLSSYFSLFGDLYLQQVFMRSLRLSLLSTAICALLGFRDGVLYRRAFPTSGNDDGVCRVSRCLPVRLFVHSAGWSFSARRASSTARMVSLGIFAKPQSLLCDRVLDVGRALCSCSCR